MAHRINAAHVPIQSLWKYSKKQARLNWIKCEHLMACEFCIGVLNLCTLNASLTAVKHLVSEYLFIRTFQNSRRRHIMP
jgi:hypothetical protein